MLHRGQVRRQEHGSGSCVSTCGLQFPNGFHSTGQRSFKGVRILRLVIKVLPNPCSGRHRDLERVGEVSHGGGDITTAIRPTAPLRP